ncbi:MAG: cobyrinate a,c-diamide synthase [Thermoanaerobacteraceae bacterium]
MSKTFMIAGTHSGVGKTTISLGIMGVLAKEYKVIPFKIGPDYIDTAYHKYVTGNFSVNLDLYMLGEEKLKELYYKNLSGADISIIEGVMGLYDGFFNTSYGSTAHIAKILNIPVILVVDASSMAASVSALIMGYINYDKKVNIIGVILNKVGSDRHYNLLKEIIERDLDIKVLGYLPQDIKIDFPERHLGLVPVHEMPEIDYKLELLYEHIKRNIDLDQILKISKSVNQDLYTKTHIGKVNNNYNIKIAYAFDEAFNFYYKDGLKVFEEIGVELLPFSPLNDLTLPEDVHGLYIGGGFPEIFANRLSKNKRMLLSIKEAIDSGMPTYAECGGFMYLTKLIKNLDEETFEMVSVFDSETIMTKRLQRFGYVEAEVIKDNILFKKGEKIKGHEFHHSKIEGVLGENSYIVHKPGREEKWECGYIYKNCLATYVHINLYTYKESVKRFVEKCDEYKKMHILQEDNYVT